MRDMEQEAEPEGGPIADDYGDRLNQLDQQIADLEAQLYDQGLEEEKVEESSPELDAINKQLDSKEKEVGTLMTKKGQIITKPGTQV
jgi:hypothetical protein